MKTLHKILELIGACYYCDHRQFSHSQTRKLPYNSKTLSPLKPSSKSTPFGARALTISLAHFSTRSVMSKIQKTIPWVTNHPMSSRKTCSTKLKSSARSILSYQAQSERAALILFKTPPQHLLFSIFNYFYLL